MALSGSAGTACIAGLLRSFCCLPTVGPDHPAQPWICLLPPAAGSGCTRQRGGAVQINEAANEGWEQPHLPPRCRGSREGGQSCTDSPTCSQVLWRVCCASGEGFCAKWGISLLPDSPVGLPARADPALWGDGVSVSPSSPCCRWDRASPQQPGSFPARVRLPLHSFRSREEKKAGGGRARQKPRRWQAVRGAMAPAAVLTWCFHSSEKAPGQAGKSPAVCADESGISITKAELFSIP